MTDESQLSAEPPEAEEAGSDLNSREKAVIAAIRKFDGFEVREDWDVAEAIKATLEAAGYEPLIEVILAAAANAGHIHYDDECPVAEELEENTRLMQAFRNGRWRAEDERDALLDYIAGRVGSEAVSAILDAAGVVPVGGRRVVRVVTGFGSDLGRSRSDVRGLPVPPGTPVVVLTDDSGEKE